jgi:hypothetical protein
VIVYDTTLIRLKSAFQQYPNSAGDLPTDVKVRQDLKSPARMRVTLIYPDRTEELTVA